MLVVIDLTGGIWSNCLQKEKNRFKAPNNEATIKSIEQIIKILDRQKEQIEQQIQQEIDKDKYLKEK